MYCGEQHLDMQNIAAADKEHHLKRVLDTNNERNGGQISVSIKVSK